MFTRPTNRSLFTALALAAASTTTASAQDALTGFNHPLDQQGGTLEFMSFEGIVELGFTGDADGNAVTTSIQFFTIAGDGTSAPVLLGAPITIDENASTLDTDLDGTFGDTLTDAHTGPVRIDMDAVIASSAQARTNRDLARTVVAGNAGAIGVSFIFDDGEDAPVTTTMPSTFNAESSGEFSPDGNSPRLLDGPLELRFALAQFPCRDMSITASAPFTNNDPGNPNGTILEDIVSTDFQTDSDPSFSNPLTPTALRGSAFLRGEQSPFLVMPFDDTLPMIDIPVIGDYVRTVSGTIQDFTGRRLSLDTDGEFVNEVHADPEICLADCDLSETVDFGDLVSMLFEFDNPIPQRNCDPDQNGAVNFADLVTALFNFGPCPTLCTPAEER